MATVLLFDDDILFKAVEGTCLRRERCRLVKAPPASAARAARRAGADLILASTAARRADLAAVFSDSTVARVPVLVLDFGGPRGIRADAQRAADGRGAPIRFLKVPTDDTGRLDLAALDPRFEAAIKEELPELDRRSDRVPISVPVECRGRGFTTVLRSRNISSTGLFLRTGLSLAPGRRFRFCLRLPGDPGGEDGPAVRGRCEVVRRVVDRPAGAAGHVDLIPGLGVRILDMDEKDRRTLSRFVRTSAPAARAAPAH